MDPTSVYYGVLIFMWLEFSWELYLTLRQRRIYKKHLVPPQELKDILDFETFDKARKYALDKSTFGIFQQIFGQVLSTLILCLSGFKYLWNLSSHHAPQWSLDHEIAVSLTFVFLSNIFNYVIGFPFVIYDTFVLEQKHGFNKQTPAFFIKDQIKKFIVSQVILLPLVVVIIRIIQYGGEYFFLYLWLFVLVFTLFMMIVYPEFIAPLFDKYTPLHEGSLRTRIEELAASIDFPLYKLFVVEGSKRSSHSNAYFYGFFKFKRIVLFDTLLEEEERKKLPGATTTEVVDANDKEEENRSKGCNTEEILAVLGHELGHWKLNHVLKNVIISEINIFAMFALFKYLYQDQNLYSAFGFTDDRPILIGLMIILQFIMAPYNSILNFIMTVNSRRFEFQADEFAVGLGKARELRTALIKLNNDNLGFPIYDYLYSAWHHSHPPLLERIEALKKTE